MEQNPQANPERSTPWTEENPRSEVKRYGPWTVGIMVLLVASFVGGHVQGSSHPWPGHYPEGCKVFADGSAWCSGQNAMGRDALRDACRTQLAVAPAVAKLCTGSGEDLVNAQDRILGLSP